VCVFLSVLYWLLVGKCLFRVLRSGQGSAFREVDVTLSADKAYLYLTTHWWSIQAPRR